MTKKILLTLLIALTLVSTNVYAWDDCPTGEVNDPYPGDCKKYIDTDSDGICDHSQPAPEDRISTNTTAPTSTNTETSTPQTDLEHAEAEEDLYSVEIPGSELKLLTIQEVADLWEIPATELLSETIKEFSLIGNYTIKSTIDEIREESKFSPAQIKEVAERIKVAGQTPASDSDKSTLLAKSTNINNQDNLTNSTSNLIDKDTEKLLYGLVLIVIPLVAIIGYSLVKRYKK